jgi:acyl-coenzyme A synthetase/AMP-(fatty) acid ligase
VRVLDELPKNANGKVQRRQVASIVLDQAPMDVG